MLVYFIVCPWPFTVPGLYFDVPGNRSGAEVLRSQYRDTSYAFEDWRFTYNGTTPFVYVLAPVLSYALGGPLLGVALLGLARGLSRRRAIDLLLGRTDQRTEPFRVDRPMHERARDVARRRRRWAKPGSRARGSA